MIKKSKNSVNIKKNDSKVIWLRIDGLIIVKNMEDNSYFRLDGLGAHIWEMFDGKRDMDGVINEVAKSHRKKRSLISRDVKNLIDSLKDSGLIKIGPGL